MGSPSVAATKPRPTRTGNLSALDDTMFDLMLDGVGGVIGAMIGPL